MKHTFVRYGGINIRKQKGYGKKTYHAPPASKGFYAFPLKAVEFFLLGGEFDGLKFEQKIKQKRIFKVSPSTLIWHHLIENATHPIFAVHNDNWIKTTVEQWAKLYKRCSLELKYNSIWTNSKIKRISEVSRSGISGVFNKDHFEVFFEEYPK